MTRQQPDHEEVLGLDHYLDTLLAAGDEHDRLLADTTVDPTLRAAAQRLRRDLVRVHPSFRFEERLAQRLAAAARRRARTAAGQVAAGAEGIIVPFVPAPATRDPREQALLDAIALGAVDPAIGRPIPHPVLLRGAITSAALSIAGVAWVAWRASHRKTTRRSAMWRAARAAHARRGSEGGLSRSGWAHRTRLS